MTKEPLTDLIRACIAGDGGAQARFFTRFQPLVERTVRYEFYKRGVYPSADADPEDIVNDVFTQLFADNCRRLEGLRDAARIDAWLMTVTRNRTLDTIRRAIRQETVVATAEEAQTYETNAEPADHHDAQRILAALEPVDRVILNLYFIEQLTYAEVAAALDMNPNTVSSRLRRARLKLREDAERYGYDVR